ncbi:hypothetical protein ACM66B_005341 [Microbotryomycetes sp. NB124-2]
MNWPRTVEDALRLPSEYQISQTLLRALIRDDMSQFEREQMIQALCAARYNSFYVASRYNRFLWLSVATVLAFTAAVRFLNRINPFVRLLDSDVCHRLSISPLCGSQQSKARPLLKRSHAFAAWTTVQVPLAADGFILVLYFLFNFYLTFFRYHFISPNPFFPNDTRAFPIRQYLRGMADRTGIMSFGSTPLVILLATRHSPISWLSGSSFARLQVYHRWVSRITFGLAFVHSLVFFVLIAAQRIGWSVFWDKRYLRWGLLAFAAGVVLCFGSWRRLREISYEIFLVGHILSAFLWILGSYYHVALLHAQHRHLVWIYFATSVWAFERCVRLLSRLLNNYKLLHSRMTRTTATATVCSRGDFIHLVITTGSELALSRIGPGSYVYLSFTGLGRTRAWQSHPFSIAWPVEAHGSRETTAANGFEVLLRPCSGLTAHLYERLTSSNDEPSLAKSKWVDVQITGPYGEVYSLAGERHVVIVVGGSGIAVALAHLADMARHLRQGTLKTRRVTLIWATRNAESAQILQSFFERLLTGPNPWPTLHFLDLRVYLTRPASSVTLVYSFVDYSAKVKQAIGLDLFRRASVDFVHLSVKCGRPDLDAILEEVLATRQVTDGQLYITACGPTGLCDLTREAVRARVQQGVRALDLVLLSEFST